MTYLADVKLHKANWNCGQAEFINANLKQWYFAPLFWKQWTHILFFIRIDGSKQLAFTN